jgi:Protein of unknown function (DUF2892)
MKKNIGTSGRVLRVVIAIVLLFLAWWYQSWILLAIGLFTLYEAAASWCVVYHLMGKSSCSIKKDKS